MALDIQRQKIFEEYPIPRAVFKLAVPSILSMLVTVIYNLADTYFVGRLGDPDQVAAVTLSLPFSFIFMAFGNLFGTGGGTFISRLLGRKETEKVRQVSSFCAWGAVCAGALCTLCYFLFQDLTLRLAGTSESTYGFTQAYLGIIMASGPILTLQHTLVQMIRGEGAAKESMRGMLLGTILNILLDPIFILTFSWGVAGAAIATFLGHLCTVAYYCLYLRGERTLLTLSPREFAWKGAVGPVVKIGIPASLNTLMLCMAQILLNNVAASYGDLYVAAVGVAHRIVQVPRLILIGLAQGTQPLIGYSFAARNHQRMNRAILFSGGMGMAFGTVCFAIILLFAETFCWALLPDAEVLPVAAEFARIYIAALPVLGLLFLFIHVLQGICAAVPSLLLSVFRDGVMFIPAIYLLEELLGVKGICLAQPTADIFSIVLGLVFYILILRKLKAQRGLAAENG